MQGVRLSLGFRGLAVIHSASPIFVGYVVLIGSLCTTEGRGYWLIRGVVNPFSSCSQILVLQVFYSCEQKMTSVVKATKQAQILDPQQIHQQSYPQVVTF
jgi:Na+-translocating ferredoxin:NAD+ oxidoreductase RnfD subunit